ncbi:MAG: hypothetical protein LBU62_11165 [Bacteroidales bacterium]|nr:hypothetical protein [Bacteroidales bacterium]
MNKIFAIRLFGYFILSCCLLTGVRAQSIQVNVQLDTSTILIGDQIKLLIELEKRSTVSVQFPHWSNEVSPHIEIVSVSALDSAKVSEELMRYRQELIVTSFDSGRHEVAAIRFPFTDGEHSDTIRTTPLFLDVLVMPTDSLTDIADIKPIYQLPIGWADILPWLAIIGAILLGLAIIAFVVYVIVRKKQNRPIFGIEKPAEPPHIVALRELDKLRSEKLWQNNRIKDYYTRLSDIVRTYIEGRFEVAAMEMTSEEILAGLKNSGFEDNNLANRLRQMFSLSDLVKFAKIDPLPNENETTMLDSYLFVNNTKVETIPENAQGEYKKLKIVSPHGWSVDEMLADVGNGGRFVRYTYCVSVIAFTFRSSSSIYFVRSDKAPIHNGWPFLLISFFFGWWGIPWGPVYTIQSIYRAFRGRDLTREAVVYLSLDTSIREIRVDVSDDSIKHGKKGKSKIKNQK